MSSILGITSQIDLGNALVGLGTSLAAIVALVVSFRNENYANKTSRKNLRIKNAQKILDETSNLIRISYEASKRKKEGTTSDYTEKLKFKQHKSKYKIAMMLPNCTNETEQQIEKIVTSKLDGDFLFTTEKRQELRDLVRKYYGEQHEKQ